CDCHYRREQQPAGHPHLWAGCSRASSEAVHEDHFSRTGGIVTMARSRLKAGETVVVISGSHKGKQGKLLQVLPRKDRAIVEGVNLVKRHERKTQDNPQGAIIEREASIHVSRSEEHTSELQSR